MWLTPPYNKHIMTAEYAESQTLFAKYVYSTEYISKILCVYTGTTR
jgi:hypothetical protein